MSNKSKLELSQIKSFLDINQDLDYDMSLIYKVFLYDYLENVNCSIETYKDGDGCPLDDTIFINESASLNTSWIGAIKTITYKIGITLYKKIEYQYVSSTGENEDDSNTIVKEKMTIYDNDGESILKEVVKSYYYDGNEVSTNNE